MPKMTNEQLIQLANASPKLAEKVYHDQQASEAIQAWGEFQARLTPVSKRGHVDHWNKRQGRYTPMYRYVYFEDVKKHTNDAMRGTGLTWHQIPDVKAPVRATMLDKRGNPTGQLTVGEAVGIMTVIMYKNGTPLSSGYMRTTSTSTSPKDVGSASTYCRRYSLCIATGMSSAPDTDGRQQGRNFPRRRVQQRRPPMQRLSGATTPRIGNAKGQALSGLITKVAKKQGKAPMLIQNFIRRTYANNAPLSQMPIAQYGRVRQFLNQYI